MFLDPPRSLHIRMSHQHQVVPLRRPVLQDEVRFLDVRRKPDQSHRDLRIKQIIRGSVHISTQWRVGLDWFVLSVYFRTPCDVTVTDHKIVYLGRRHMICSVNLFNGSFLS